MIELTDDERDALQETMNISMGQAGNALARLIQTQVTLSVPAIKAMSPADFHGLIQGQDNSWFARQSFMGALRGEVITSIQRDGCEAMATLMDFETPLDKAGTEEFVLEITNVVSAACLQGFSRQLKLSTQLAMPAFYYPATLNGGFEWSSILMMDIDFRIEHMQFDARVLIGLSEESIDQMLIPIRAMLE